MLSLQDVTKTYQTGEMRVEALKGISLTFPQCQFAAILGPSGCGKTTLLNIIGGLDHYTTGEMTVDGVSTKEYADTDWDAYRNHTIGFVFQNYNLIAHQTVLSNVELALTLSGVGKSERRARAMEALERVGLTDQAKKRPNQLSGGQMQRVAIARALVNNPDVLLADEPTGALDTESSEQIMKLLKEVARDRLVLMVTHNPDLADRYATRVIRLLDGRVVGDSAPCEADAADKTAAAPVKKASMSFGTALALSINNLMTKKTRTFLTAFAGSIGIIGIAHILFLSNGVNNYIHGIEEDTLSSYPLMIEKSAFDMTGMMNSFMDMERPKDSADDDTVYSSDVMGRALSMMNSGMKENNLKDFMAYLENDADGIARHVNDIQYGYATPLSLYRDTEFGVVKVNPSSLVSGSGIYDTSEDSIYATLTTSSMYSSSMSQMDVFKELFGNRDMLSSQYEVLAGRMPEAKDEMVFIVNKRNMVSDYLLYALGIKDPDEIEEMMRSMVTGDAIDTETMQFSYEDLMRLSFRLVPDVDLYEKTAGGFVDHSGDDAYILSQMENAMEIRIVGVIRPNPDAAVTNNQGGIGYTKELTEYLVNYVADSEIVRAQQAYPDIDVLTGMPFAGADIDVKKMLENFDTSTLTPAQQAIFSALSEEQLLAFAEKQMKSMRSESSYEENMVRFGVTSLADPTSIYLYPKDFEAKEEIVRIIKEYNDGVGEENAVTYTDYVGVLMSSVTTIVNAISYILIAFVAISLIVSSIMIGIITYISVLERTKEIGILRAIGASKRDIARVFNAETLAVGFSAGVIGIGVTLLLVLIINLILLQITGLANLAGLPMSGGAILIGISMLLTFIAGLIPSRIAAKKDPVIALRSE